MDPFIIMHSTTDWRSLRALHKFRSHKMIHTYPQTCEIITIQCVRCIYVIEHEWKTEKEKQEQRCCRKIQVKKYQRK